jgi:glycosyltransferase involved in cell wall biosynthesis
VRLSILIPAYQQEGSLAEVLERTAMAAAPDWDLEIVVCDDGSTDGSAAIAESCGRRDPRIRVVRHDRHRGRGPALRSALTLATGDACLLMDGRGAYDPDDAPRLVEALAAGARVVFGSRLLTGSRPADMPWSSYLGHRLRTMAANRLFDLGLTDEATAMIAIETELLRSLELGDHPSEELAAQLGQRQIPIAEVPVRFTPRPRDRQPGLGCGLRGALTLFRRRLG